MSFIGWGAVGYLLIVPAILVVLDKLIRRGQNFPDGPPSFPMFGNMFDVGGPFPHFKLTEWSKKYGDFFAYRMAQSPVIVLSSPEVLHDLFVKRGQRYSSRPQSSKQAALITQNARIINMPYGDKFREHRKAMHELLGMENAKMFLPFQEYESRRLLKNLLNQPGAFWQEVSRFSGSITFSMLLGCRFERSDAFIPQQIGMKMQKFFAHIQPGAWLVDWVPILDHLPNFLAPWRKQAVTIRDQIMPFYLVFYEAMKERVQNGTAPDCFVARLLGESGRVMSQEEHAHIIAELITAGTETTATTLQWFLKAAVLYPEPIQRAQAEIDRVVGAARLPAWEDRSNLPYVSALINELHRWATATPLAFIHATSDGDTYKGKTIPKGTTVMANVFAIHNNPKFYPEPEHFIPERFLDQAQGFTNEAKSLKSHFAFSVGRRECPGKHVANASLYIAISRILWAFDIKPKPDAPPPPGYTGAFPVYGPAFFDCIIKPRTTLASNVIREQAEVDRPKEMEDSSIYDKYFVEIK